MKKIVLFSVLIGLFSFASAQSKKEDRSKVKSEYPTLELRYSTELDVNSKEITVEGKTYPCMPSKERALAYVKNNYRHSGLKTVVYYLPSTEPKATEEVTIE